MPVRMALVETTSLYCCRLTAYLGHCLHNLHHSLTCNADMTIRVMRWHPNLLLPSPIDHEHECMNWDSIDEWAKERYVDTATPGLLVHPTKGKFYFGRNWSSLANYEF